MTTRCVESGCEREAIAGFCGRWLCPDHFTRALNAARTVGAPFLRAVKTEVSA